jgi:hypothetical protein
MAAVLQGITAGTTAQKPLKFLYQDTTLRLEQRIELLLS